MHARNSSFEKSPEPPQPESRPREAVSTGSQENRGAGWLSGLPAALVLIMLAGCRTAAPTAPLLAAQLDQLFSSLHSRQLFEGAVVVGRGSEIVWQNGYGLANEATGTRFTPQTPADTGSMAKTITAALVIALHHERLLDLDDPVQNLIPELPYGEVTLRHLLSHSSGIPGDYERYESRLPPDQERTTEMFLNALSVEKPDLEFRPGAAYRYNNFGYDVAALAAARAAKRPLSDLLAERYFTPLGMTAILRPGRLEAFPQPRTRGYRRVQGHRQAHDIFDLEAFHGASNIYMSALDLHRWNASFLRGRHSQPEVSEYARIGIYPSGLTLGSWYRSSDGDRFWYAGHLQGFHAEVFRDTRLQTSVVYVSNNTIEPWLQHAVVRAVNGLLAGETTAMPSKPQTAELPADRSVLSGRWRLGSSAVVETQGSGPRMTMLKDGVVYDMFPMGDRFLYVPGLHYVVGFSSEKSPFDTMYVGSVVAEEWARRE